MSILQTTRIAVAKAEDTQDLLEHISWTDVIRPQLITTRDKLAQLLVNSTLGAPVRIETPQGIVEVSKEQLAGKIYGINYIIKLFEDILRKGEKAYKELNNLGYNPTNIV